MARSRNTGKAKEGIGKTVDGVSKFARSASAQLTAQTGDLKNVAVATAGKLATKKPDAYEQATVDYNGAYTSMVDKGLSLLRQRERSTDLIELIELLVSSIANTPKSFKTDFDDIRFRKAQFLSAAEFAQKELDAARQSAASAGAGFTGGAAVALIAPSAAMWVATTFGTASTGTAISTLSGAAATNAALAWLGGGTLAVGGGGIAAGSALLALAGPIGWTVAGATLLTSIALFTKKKQENREERQRELTKVRQNTADVTRRDAQITDLLRRTAALRELLVASYRHALQFFGADFRSLSTPQRSQLAALVNNTKVCAALLAQRIPRHADGS